MMPKQNSRRIKLIEKMAEPYHFPEPLQFQEYRDKSTMKDVVKVFFRYAPVGYPHRPEKFGFEVTFDTGKSASDKMKEMKEQQIAKMLRSLESSWKNQFDLILYQGIPYTDGIADDEYMLRCEICDEKYKIIGEELRYRKDIYLCYALKEIDCNCNESSITRGSDVNLQTDEGAHFTRV